MSNEVPTAEEYLKDRGMANVGHYGLLISDPSKRKMHEIMEDYANLKAQFHVEAALQAAAKKASLKYPLRDNNEVVKSSILNSYPKENII